ncbi:uncharacterized protein BT62DRAFT_693539 [Guyanagaster necrorhizus]|uniref:Uncharacterized protein n=1 Tax=Guyanagaster necrorhizus TaxID=856835 RepID=A0A9P7VEV7_9AGAR|nr:uncharacterized protein BT62DRAFT_693539 [Guyanagaster necrorhizus MCA 3950]KAG7439648.1 hypothetical protein BT62DRAFT_693539 [Guyanagaster necrorhizus MCA 3950]
MVYKSNTPILVLLTVRIGAVLSTLLADTTLIWRCGLLWANRCHIVIYIVGVFIATGTMMLGLVVPLAMHEVQPVIGIGEWVVVYGAPEYLSFLRRLPVVITLLAEERQKEPPVPLTSIECRCVVWSLAGNVGVIVQNGEHTSTRIEGMYRWRRARYDINIIPPDHNLLGDLHMIVLLPMSSPVSVPVHCTHQNLPRRQTASHPSRSEESP